MSFIGELGIEKCENLFKDQEGWEELCKRTEYVVRSSVFIENGKSPGLQSPNITVNKTFITEVYRGVVSFLPSQGLFFSLDLSR